MQPLLFIQPDVDQEIGAHATSNSVKYRNLRADSFGLCKVDCGSALMVERRQARY